MPYVSFHHYFPEIAEKETRTMTTIKRDGDVPKGSYGLLEMYCNDPGCDCRRVFLEVYDWERGQSMAYIAYGWGSTDFYRKWLGQNDLVTIQELQGPILNLASPQTRFAPAFLELVRDIILRDPDYIDRIKRHYQMFKEKVDPQRYRKSRKVTAKSKSRKRHRQSPD